MPKLLFIYGSFRAKSSSRATAITLAERMKDRAEVEIAMIGDLPHYNADITGDPKVMRFIAAVDATDGVVFVTPEYNYSVPGVLKNAIDWASRPAFASVFKGKQCFIVSTSGGALGGVRAQAHLKYILDGMLAKVFSCKEIVVPFANDKTKNGILTDSQIVDFALENLESFADSLGH